MFFMANYLNYKILYFKTLNRIINGEELSYWCKRKYKQYIDEYNQTGKIKYLEEYVPNNT